MSEAWRSKVYNITCHEECEASARQAADIRHPQSPEQQPLPSGCAGVPP